MEKTISKCCSQYFFEELLLINLRFSELIMFHDPLTEPVRALDLLIRVVLFAAAHEIFAALFILLRNVRSRKELDLPVVGDPSTPDFREAMEEGARKVSWPAAACFLMANDSKVPYFTIHSPGPHRTSCYSPSVCN